jgi:transposase
LIQGALFDLTSRMKTLDVKRLDHHGIVAGTFDALGFETILNEVLGVDEQEIVTPGQAIKALIIAGLGFTNSPLMLTPNFFENLPVEQLIGKNVTAEMLNRHKLGRVLDAFHEKGCSSIFSLLAAQACKKEKVNQITRSLDTTSFCVTGEYNGETDTNTISICHGYSKDHRPDLKQIIVELVVSQDGGIPLLLSCHDGNESDTKIFKERSQKLVASLKQSESIKAWVGDAKLYSESNAEILAQLPFITRIPRTLKEENNLVDKALRAPNAWTSLTNAHGYRYQSHTITHYGIEQRWLVVYSEAAKQRGIKTVLKEVEREKEKLNKMLFHFQAQRFFCRSDGEKEFKKLSKGIKYHELAKITWDEIKKYAGCGRPNSQMEPSTIEWQGHAKANKDENKINMAIELKACFTIGTRIDENAMSAEEIVQTYKGQSAVETGFRFLKDPLFFTSSFFLKKPARIEALLTVMTLALLIYSIAQRRLRSNMEKLKETIPNQIGLADHSPTLRWVFQMFTGVNLVFVENEIRLHGMTPLRTKIIRLFGYKTMSAIYQNFGASG